MLERLDEVPWDTLEHAYGTAEDVQDRALSYAGEAVSYIGEIE